MPDNRKVTVDGVSYDMTDQGAQLIERLQGTIRSLNDASAKVTSDHATALAAKDTELAKKDAEIAKLKTQVMDAAALDKLVAERSALVTRARAVFADLKPEGLSAEDIRRTAVGGALGADTVKDKPQAYIDARFDILVEDAVKKAGGADKFAATLKEGVTVVDSDETAVVRKNYNDMVSEMTDAWKTIPGAAKVA